MGCSYTQEYRSGHNEAVLKTVRPKATGVRIPLPAPIKMVYSLWVDLFLLPQSEGTNSLSQSETGSSHTAGTEYTSRHRVFAVSASRGDIGLNLYSSGTISTNLTPSSIPLFQAYLFFLRQLLYVCSNAIWGNPYTAIVALNSCVSRFLTSVCIPLHSTYTE